MGATTFMVKEHGKSAKEAFERAQRQARYEYGHGGYTGTIAEKDSFTEITTPKEKDPVEFAYNLIDKDDPRISDKWGPAGCIDLGKDGNGRMFLFFGWASQ